MAERALGTDDTIAGDPLVTGSVTTSAASAPRVVGGRYRIDGLLGSGGMGSVYRALDQELDETVALKLLRRELVDAPAMLARFRQEVKLARRVTHTNVARVFDIGEDGADKFLTMEYIEGEPLSAALRRGPLPFERLQEIARALCAGLSAAHGAGVVHRDLKPDNILLAPSGRVVITDFGIARAFLEGGEVARTQGGILGTPAYMAPEQVEGSREIDERADLYALGAVLFELATGERAWRGDAVLAVAAARLTHPPPDPRARRPDLPDALAEVILRCLARRREDRYTNAAELGAALDRAFLGISRWTPAAAREPAFAARADKSVAVLPFRNGGPPEDEYLAEGLTEDLTDTLSMTRGLRVRPHSVVARQADPDPRTAGRGLDVQVVIEGSVRRAGERTRVSARAIHVSDGFQIWAHRFEASPGDLLVSSDRMAQAIAAALTADLKAAVREGPSDPEAVELYLRARRELRSAWNGDPRLAAELFEKAVARAPEDGNLLANRALALTRRVFIYGGPRELEEAAAAAERAVAAAPDLGESWVALSSTRMYRGEPAAAAEAVRTGLQRAPSAGRLHDLAARLQLEVDLLDEALLHGEASLRLDPSLTETPWDLARLHALRGDWDRADALLELSADDDSAYLGRTVARARLAIWRGRRADVPADLEQRKNANSLLIQLLKMGQQAQTVGALDDSHAEFIAKIATPDRRRLSALLWQVHVELACALDDRPRALAGLARALDNNLFDVSWLTRCPVLQVVRDDTSYASTLARVQANAAPIRAVLAGV